MSQEEFSQVLRRAQEIDAGQHDSPDVEAMIRAAEEAGISREATTQAIRERLGFPVAAATLGGLVFARSADGHFYAARVEETKENQARVRFLSGAVATLPMADLREFSLMPGQKVNYLSPTGGYWANGTISTVNVDALTVTLASWGMEETVSLAKVRHLSQNFGKTVQGKMNEWVVRLWWLGGGVAIGMIVNRLISR